VFRIELDRLDGGVGALRRLPGVVTATLAAGDQADGKADRQTVEVNLALIDDAALGGVVGALGGLGAHILALRKSEPSLEDVFVELVGRGFGDESTDDDERTGSDASGDRSSGGGRGDAGDEPNVTDSTDEAREREVEVVG
jgi:hypothetical protein